MPGFGPAGARVLVLGLAPAAHGTNRTGRMFSGDRSGDRLYASLHHVGLANQPTSVSADDGLALTGVRITAPVHCAPPANKPTPAERDTRRPWLVRELELLWPRLRVVVVLGAIGWTPLFGRRCDSRAYRCRCGCWRSRTAPKLRWMDGRTVLGCYHVSQQNTFTGRRTEPMLDAVFSRPRGPICRAQSPL